MRRSCPYCGRIHQESFVCPMKIKRQALKKQREDDGQDKIRRSSRWTRKSIEIRERDMYMCQLCLRGIETVGLKEVNFDSCQVHHIVPLAEDQERAFDNDNLITLCTYHHEMAERGEIGRALLLDIAREQEEKLEERLKQ